MSSANHQVFKFPDPAQQNAGQPVVPASYTEQPNLLFIEGLNEELDAKFMSSIVEPYLKGVFDDLCLRSQPPPRDAKCQKSIDKVCFGEYNNLPGIIADRFFNLAKDTSKDPRIQQEPFLKLFKQVYSSSLDQKMELAFRM